MLKAGRQLASLLNAELQDERHNKLTGQMERHIVESIIEQPIVMSYHDFTPEQRRAVGIPDNMIRVACGIENPEDLIDDFKQALER